MTNATILTALLFLGRSTRLAALLAAIAVWLAPSGAVAVPRRGDVMPISAPKSTLLAQVPNQTNPNFIADAVARMGPAVVRINASRTVRRRSPLFPNRPDRNFQQQGEGSGFIVTRDGLVFTNAHVVSEADRVEVELKDGRSLSGTVLGADPLTDVAVVKIDADNLPTVTLGDSTQLTPGEWAIAIGNPLGLSNTVTVGIVSAVGRSASDVGIPIQRAEFIQTDAAINPGNSGGPLLNQWGQVIGINTAIVRGANGIGFAVPIATAQRIAEQLVEHGRVLRAYLGIQMTTLTPALRDRINSDSDIPFRVSESAGVLVQAVEQNGPAARAGLRAGDAIVAIEGQTVQDTADFQSVLEGMSAGEVVTLRVSRNGSSRNVRVTASEFPQALVSR
ncbi:MAG: trypsin-like peptidase domain-containing protein [Cyanobacteria bacterium P01_F01_bin.33]